MRQQLPKEIDPFKLAYNGIELEGEIPVAKMARLAESLYSTDGTVKVKMHFDIDSTGTPFLQGHFETSLSLICERCLAPMQIDLDVDSLLALVKSELKVEGLAEQYEPWLLDTDEPVDPAVVVEDELILALPLVPRHDEDCLPKEAWYSGEQEREVEKPTSPFEVLSVLKSKK